MTEKKQKKKDALIRLLGYVAENKGSMLVAIVLTLLANVASLAIPLFSGQAIDAISQQGGVNFNLVYTYGGRMLVAVLANCILSYLASLVLVRVSSSITVKMRRQVFDRLLDMPVSFFDTHQVGDIVSRISYDIDTINTSLSSDLITIATTIVTVVGSFIMMLRISLPLCSIFVITIPMIIWISRHRAIKVRPLFHQRSVKLGELNGFAEEMLSGHKTIKAYGQEETIIKRFNEHNDEAVDAYYEADYQGSIVGPTVTFVNNLSLSMISGLGAFMYLQGSVSLGAISSFILYSRRFCGPISEMANLFAEFQSMLSAAARVFGLMDQPLEPADSQNAIVLDHVQGSVDIDHLHFGYLPDKEILHGISLSAEPGKTIAIVGATGAGKTTIINLLMRFYDPDSGEIRIDGNNTMDCTRDSVRRQFSMVLQDTWLFEGTVYENVAYGRADATREDVIRVCKQAHIDSFIQTLPKGYDTVLTDSGVNISKGQKQLLTIARAMLSDARMLILDEATSNVDSRTEQDIQEALAKLCAGKTSFVIAHRLSTIQNADQILVLDHGTIVERGTHESLLQAGGVYAKLFNAQWEN